MLFPEVWTYIYTSHLVYIIHGLLLCHLPVCYCIVAGSQVSEEVFGTAMDVRLEPHPDLHVHDIIVEGAGQVSILYHVTCVQYRLSALWRDTTCGLSAYMHIDPLL